MNFSCSGHMLFFLVSLTRIRVHASLTRPAVHDDRSLVYYCFSSSTFASASTSASASASTSSSTSSSTSAILTSSSSALLNHFMLSLNLSFIELHSECLACGAWLSANSTLCQGQPDLLIYIFLIFGGFFSCTSTILGFFTLRGSSHFSGSSKL